MRWNKKIKAGALQFVLFTGAIIAILLMSFVLISHTHNLFHKKTDLLVTLIKVSESGIMSSLEKQLPLGGTTDLKDQSDINAQITIKRNYWGIFEKRSATAQHGKNVFTKIALIGSDQNEMAALYLRDKQRPLVIAGDAKITGTAFLPEQGIKMGNIYGNSYHRPRLVYGEQKKSHSWLPKLNYELQRQLSEITGSTSEPYGEELTYTPNMTVQNSFDSPTKVLKGHTIRLEGTKLAGNIIVWAQQKIIVEQNSYLQDVLLLAPEIVIKDWVKGYFQAIAGERITVGKKCELSYPTALVVHSTRENSEKKEEQPIPNIYVDSYSEIKGVVAFLSTEEEQKHFPQIKIDDNAKVIGELFCSENLELKGRVTGTVTTAAFIALENGSIYMNHLYNGKINSTNLSRAYSGLLMGDLSRSKKIMKWLY